MRKWQSMAMFMIIFSLHFIPLTDNTLLAQHSKFTMHENGKIAVDGLSFDSSKEYLQSDFFKIAGKRCGTKRLLLPGEQSRMLPENASDCTVSQTIIESRYWPSTVLIIPVVVHIIYKQDGTGNIDDARVIRQIEVLNQDYAAITGTMGENGFNTKIQFSLKKITRTVNDNWFNNNDETEYKSALGWDQARFCNIYVNLASGYLGYAYFPQDNAGVLDGLVIFYEAFGGRNEGLSPYNQGRTVVHEMGHYLGLYHTFEGYEACQNSYTTGDLIVDTPAESRDHYGCSQTTTCDSPDPIDNYMNYTDDLCMEQFTPEQGNRMVCSLVNYRPSLARIAPAGSSLPAAYMLLLEN